jgi:tRNA-dihydrouridine synthase
VGIPVFGNGDVFDQHDCRKIIEETACDGVALGRIAIAKPWIFAEWSHNRKFGPEKYLEAALGLAGFLEKHYDGVRAIRRFKRFADYYVANFKFGHTLHSRLINASDISQIKNVLSRFLQAPPELVTRPNLNFFK